ncbi:hypothetical protein Tco_0533818 [Tanacetum coccineum]
MSIPSLQTCMYDSAALLVCSSGGVIMEYLVKISKKARILELKRRHLKITVLTSYTPLVLALTDRHPTYHETPSDQIPRDILVVNAKQLVTKAEKNAADIHELVKLVREQMSSALIVHSSADEPHVKKLKVVLEDIPIPSLTQQGGSAPKNLNLHQFSAAEEGPLTLEETKAQMEEIKRLDVLKAEKEKYEKRLKKVLTSQELKAQAAELAAYEAKRAKMKEEYNHCINFRDDHLPITKFNYMVNNSTKEATMRNVRNNHPLNLIMFEKFVLKNMGFTEWVKLHALACKSQTKSNDQLLKNLKAKFQWVANQARKLVILPLPKLTAFEFPLAEKKTGMKRKRRAKVIHEVFVKEDIMVDGMHKNFVPPTGVVGSPGLVIVEPHAADQVIHEVFVKEDITVDGMHKNFIPPTRVVGSPRLLIKIQNDINVNLEIAQDMYNKMIYVIEAREDVVEARKIVGPKVGFKLVKQVYRHVSNRNNASTGGIKKQAMVHNRGNSKSAGMGPNFGVSPSNHGFFNVASSSTSTTMIVERVDKLERKIIEGKLIVVDDDRKPLAKFVSMENADSNSEVEDVVDEHAVFMPSTS